MKIIISIIIFYIISITSAWALPLCEGSPIKTDDLSEIKHWNDCEGTHYFTVGDKFVGEFKDGLPNGQGTRILHNGNKYVGEYKDGKMHGQGTFIWADGRKYVGKWKNDKSNGQGTRTLPNGKILEGLWRNGKYVGKKEY